MYKIEVPNLLLLGCVFDLDDSETYTRTLHRQSSGISVSHVPVLSQRTNQPEDGDTLGHTGEGTQAKQKRKRTWGQALLELLRLFGVVHGEGV